MTDETRTLRRDVLRLCVELDDALDALERSDARYRAHRYDAARSLLRSARRHVERAFRLTARHFD